MMMGFLPVLLSMLLVLTGGGLDLLGVMTPEQYWATKGKTPTVQELIADVGTAGPSGDVKQWVADLSSSEFKTRSNAQKKLEAMGPEVIPQLREAVDSKDAEVAALAKAIVTKLSSGVKARDVERLMAIRTLGERKEPSALPALKAAMASKDPFVSDYALRAVGQIEGHPVAAVDHRADVEKDLWLLPKETGIVLQQSGSPWGAELNIASVTEKTAGTLAMPAAQQPALVKQLTAWVLQAAERIGPVRVDGLTMAVSADVGNNSGWVILMAHGAYDREAVVAAIKALAGEAMQEKTVAGATVLTIGGEGRVAFLEGRVVLITNPPPERERAEAVLEALIQAASGKGGTLKENTELAGMIEKADRSGPLWGVGVLPAEMKKALADGGYDRVTVSTKVKEGTIAFLVAGEGSDVEKVKAGGVVMDAGVAAVLTELKQAVGQMAAGESDAVKGMIGVMETLKVETAGTRTTLTGEVGPGLVESLKPALGMFAARAMRLTEEGPGQVIGP